MSAETLVILCMVLVSWCIYTHTQYAYMTLRQHLINAVCRRHGVSIAFHYSFLRIYIPFAEKTCFRFDGRILFFRRIWHFERKSFACLMFSLTLNVYANKSVVYACRPFEILLNYSIPPFFSDDLLKSLSSRQVNPSSLRHLAIRIDKISHEISCIYVYPKMILQFANLIWIFAIQIHLNHYSLKTTLRTK